MRQQQHELVATVAHEQIGSTNTGQGTRCELGKQLVTAYMAESIIDALEVVEIDDTQGQRQAIPPRALHLLRQPVRQGSTTEGAGERIEAYGVRGHPAHAAYPG